MQVMTPECPDFYWFASRHLRHNGPLHLASRRFVLCLSRAVPSAGDKIQFCRPAKKKRKLYVTDVLKKLIHYCV